MPVMSMAGLLGDVKLKVGQMLTAFFAEGIA